jgi:hypothetical protein
LAAAAAALLLLLLVLLLLLRGGAVFAAAHADDPWMVTASVLCRVQSFQIYMGACLLRTAFMDLNFLQSLSKCVCVCVVRAYVDVAGSSLPACLRACLFVCLFGLFVCLVACLLACLLAFLLVCLFAACFLSCLQVLWRRLIFPCPPARLLACFLAFRCSGVPSRKRGALVAVVPLSWWLLQCS